MIFFADKILKVAIAIALILASFACPVHTIGQEQANSGSRSGVAAKPKTVTFSKKDRTHGLKVLKENRKNFENALRGLSERQLNFRTDRKRWSVGEVAQHIILAEQLVLSLIRDKVIKTPTPPGADNFRMKDQVVFLAITNRTKKFNAPPAIQPKQERVTKPELLRKFGETRDETARFLNTTKVDLRNHFWNNPGLGAIDAYQSVLFLSAHCERHLAQIAEIKEHPNFPKK